jgi:hypothetical protein
LDHVIPSGAIHDGAHEEIDTVNWHRRIVCALRIGFVAPPTIAAIFAFASLEPASAINHLAGAALLLAVIEAGSRFATKVLASPHIKPRNVDEYRGPGYYADEFDAARHGAFFRAGEILENSGGPGFYS